MISKILLDKKAVHLSPNNFFTWSSGLKSPIYCDNRKIISAPQERDYIVDQFVSIINDKYQDVEVIAGTATAGIPWAAWVAAKMNKPMIYIRSSNKSHGLKNAIEGELAKNSKVIVIEDLISTGGSALKACNELLENQAQILCVAAIFSYGLNKAKEAFSAANIPYFALDNLENLLEYTAKEKLLNDEQLGIIEQWKKENLS